MCSVGLVGAVHHGAFESRSHQRLVFRSAVVHAVTQGGMSPQQPAVVRAVLATRVVAMVDGRLVLHLVACQVVLPCCGERALGAMKERDVAVMQLDVLLQMAVALCAE